MNSVSPDVGAYVRARAEAESRTAQGAWAEAATLWARVVEANPTEGRSWSRLADARYRTDDYQGALAAGVRALELRDGYPAETAYRLACCHARLGEPTPALTWLERSLQMGLRDLERARTDDDLASLRNDTRYRELVGQVDADGLTREERWRYDLRFLQREVKRRAYAPFRQVAEARFDAEVEALSDAVPDLTDVQVVIGMRRLLALLGDAHAFVRQSADDTALPALPLQFYLFEEGCFVTGAAPEHRELLGARLQAIGEHPIADVLATVDPLIPRDGENAIWPREIAPALLRNAALLHGLGLVPDPGEAVLRVRGLDGEERTATVAAVPPAQPAPAWRTFPCPDGWVFLPDTLGSPRPLCLRNPRAAYWFEHLPDERLVYFQFNLVRDEPGEPLAAFCDRLFAFVRDNDVQRLVIDMRWNPGGNTYLELPLLHGLVGTEKISRRGSLFVIVGRKTFSAAQNGATLIERHTEAIFVGEPTGSCPTFVGETIPFVLPCSGIQANVSDLLWQSGWPMDYRTWIAPAIYTPPTFAAFSTNRDPALEAVLAFREHLPGW
jgi:tetratricopeptide (TPR) repeat protein